MTLFEIDKAIREYIESSMNEDGEILDFSGLDELQERRIKKVENIALYSKEMDRMAKALADEIDALVRRKKRYEKKGESIRRLLNYATQGETFETAKVKVSYFETKKVEVLDADLLTEGFIRVKTTREPDKIAIKERINKGTEVPGARLVTERKVRIK